MVVIPSSSSHFVCALIQRQGSARIPAHRRAGELRDPVREGGPTQLDRQRGEAAPVGPDDAQRGSSAEDDVVPIRGPVHELTVRVDEDGTTGARRPGQWSTTTPAPSRT